MSEQHDALESSVEDFAVVASLSLDFEQLTQLAADHAGVRRRRLQPVGGVGEKVFPPTYPG
jgi:hypothetical protein